MRKTAILSAFAALLGLSACGDTLLEQGAIGGLGGAGTAAVVGGDPLVGAGVGAGANILYCQQYPGRC